jgi:hypothetical protein
VHGLTPRHRRKAGSGPPASALIAWISADPYLRHTAATVCHQRQISLTALSHARATRAACAACFVMVCVTVLGISAIISHGRASVRSQVAAPNPASPSISSAESGSVALASPAPAAIAPMLAQPAASPPATVPPADPHLGLEAGKQLSKTPGPGTSPAPIRTPRRVDQEGIEKLGPSTGQRSTSAAECTTDRTAASP